jgi:hypothetical protein
MQSNIIIEPARQQALQRIQQYRRLVEIYRFEREQLEQVIDSALMLENPVNHWQEYERLKGMMSQFVGFGARHSELATSQHYEIMLDFIEWLLPANRNVKQLEQNSEEEW